MKHLESILPSPSDLRHVFLTGIRCIETHQDDSEDTVHLAATSSLHTLQSITWDKVRIATTSDENTSTLVNIVEEGMPEFRHELPEPLREYHQFRDHMYTVDGVVVYKDRVVIPPALRQYCMTALHAAHQGVSSMIARAEASVFWPEITPAITTPRNSCNQCSRMAPSHPSAPPSPAKSPVFSLQRNQLSGDCRQIFQLAHR